LRSLQHVSVWLDDQSSDQGALPQSMDWAARLKLPLRVVVTSRQFAYQPFQTEGDADGSVLRDREPAPIIEKIKNWGIACSRRGITMETAFWVGETDVGIEKFLRPNGLCVFEDNRSDPVREQILARSRHNPELLLLLTPPTFKPMSRVLIVNQDQDPNGIFLETAARFCQALEVQPLILTIASSERDALLKQRFAEGVYSSLHLQADFDFVVCHDARAAVNRVAQWRNCSHVFFERPKKVVGISLWQRRRGDIFAGLRSDSDHLTLLAIPETLAFEFPRKTSAGPLGQPGIYLKELV